MCVDDFGVFSEYYFSAENLRSDTFLRHSMDVHGWVPVEVVCGFKRMLQLSVNEDAVIRVIAAQQYCTTNLYNLCSEAL